MQLTYIIEQHQNPACSSSHTLPNYLTMSQDMNIETHSKRKSGASQMKHVNETMSQDMNIGTYCKKKECRKWNTSTRYSYISQEELMPRPPSSTHAHVAPLPACSSSTCCPIIWQRAKVWILDLLLKKKSITNEIRQQGIVIFLNRN